VRLIYEIISNNNEYLKLIVIKPKLTLNYNNYKPDILNKRGRLNRSGRPHISTFLLDKGNLFFNYIYSTLYNMAPKRYLTLFAIIQDFFYSFFNTTINNLN
jgi:hypothetical protein